MKKTKHEVTELDIERKALRVLNARKQVLISELLTLETVLIPQQEKKISRFGN